jgi:YgiT-type zinc finger domain-containing protein
MNSTCNVCHGHVEIKLTTYTQWFEGRLIVVENVPAWVCTQCGETYYDPEVVERLQSVIWSAETPSRVIETAVYDLAASK